MTRKTWEPPTQTYTLLFAPALTAGGEHEVNQNSQFKKLAIDFTRASEI